MRRERFQVLVRKFWFVLISTVAVGMLGQQARAANALSHLIEDAKPCNSLEVTVLGAKLAVDRFKSAEIETLTLNVAGDKAKIAMVGTLACRTSDGAVAPGDASARVEAYVEANLASCKVDGNSIRISSTGGTYGFVIEAARKRIEAAIQDAIVHQTALLCK